MPAEGGETGADPFVALVVAAELSSPEVDIRMWDSSGGATGVLVPEAAVDKDSDVGIDDDDIRGAWELAGVLAVAEAVVPQPVTDSQFGAGVLAVDRSHDLAKRFRLVLAYHR